MNTENFLIEEKDLELAQSVCKEIDDEDKRSRATANAVAANVAAKFFDNNLYNVDCISGLHNLGIVLEDIDISDIYINSSYIDVRVYFNESDTGVPKEHFENNRLPAAYMFIKLNNDLSGGCVTGFITPENINMNSSDDEFYYVGESSLKSFSDIESYLGGGEDNYDVTDKQIFEYLEGSIQSKEVFYASLIASRDARLRLARAVRAQYIFNFVSTPEAQISEPEFELDLENLSLKDRPAENILEVENEKSFESLDYSTVATPVFDAFDEISKKNVIPSEDALDTVEVLTEEDLENVLPEENISQSESEEQIEALFKPGETRNKSKISGNVQNKESEVATDFKPKSSFPIKFFVIIGTLVVLITAGYVGYNKLSTSPADDDVQNDLVTEPVVSESSEQNQNDAMPVETLDSTPYETKEAGNAVSIPAIEQNLDASILVSNLKVDWEVPEGYASNTSAKRYLVKLGKVVQLNLKTELLLLNKPPITNKITVEIKYNKDSKKFETIGIIASSGEKTVDDLILQTVSKALAMNLSANTDSFAKLQGNPVLIIHL